MSADARPGRVSQRVLAGCGSIATDHLMTFGGRFADSLVVEQSTSCRSPSSSTSSRSAGAGVGPNICSRLTRLVGGSRRCWSVRPATTSPTTARGSSDKDVDCSSVIAVLRDVVDDAIVQPQLAVIGQHGQRGSSHRLRGRADGKARMRIDRVARSNLAEPVPLGKRHGVTTNDRDGHTGHAPVACRLRHVLVERCPVGRTAARALRDRDGGRCRQDESECHAAHRDR